MDFWGIHCQFGAIFLLLVVILLHMVVIQQRVNIIIWLYLYYLCFKMFQPSGDFCTEKWELMPASGTVLLFQTRAIWSLLLMIRSRTCSRTQLTLGARSTMHRPLRPSIRSHQPRRRVSLSKRLLYSTTRQHCRMCSTKSLTPCHHPPKKSSTQQFQNQLPSFSFVSIQIKPICILR